MSPRGSVQSPHRRESVRHNCPSTDTFDSGKVEAMKSAIANGSFQVNAEAIADKLLSNASEMLSASRR